MKRKPIKSIENFEVYLHSLYSLLTTCYLALYIGVKYEN